MSVEMWQPCHLAPTMLQAIKLDSEGGDPELHDQLPRAPTLVELSRS
jgi:hypothetical protein